MFLRDALCFGENRSHAMGKPVATRGEEDVVTSIGFPLK
jgi:hypothetical protein